MTESVEYPGPAPSYRWVVMFAWQFSHVFGWMVLLTLGILLPAISSDLGLSPFKQGLLGSASVWGQLGLAIPLSWWTSRFRPKLLTVVTMALGVLLLLLQGWAPGFAVLIFGRLAFGITIIAREPARALLTQQWFPRNEIVLVNSIANVLFSFIVSAGMVATPLIFSRLDNDWRETFYALAVIGAALTVMWSVLGKDRVTTEFRRREAPREAGLLRGSLSYRDLWVGGSAFLGTVAASSAFTSFFPTLMLERYGLSLQLSGLVLAISFIAGGVSGLGAARIIIRLGRGKAVLQLMGPLLVVTFVLMTLTGSLPLLVVLALANGMGFGFWPIIFTIPFQLPGIRPREVALGTSLMYVMISAGSALGPLAAGLIQEVGGDVRQSLWIISLAPLSVSVAGIYLRPRAVSLGAS